MNHRQKAATRGAGLKLNPRADFSRLDPDVLLNAEETAAVLSTTRNSLKSWRARGEGPEFRKLGTAVRYRVADLRQFISTGRENAR